MILNRLTFDIVSRRQVDLSMCRMAEVAHVRFVRMRHSTLTFVGSHDVEHAQLDVTKEVLWLELAMDIETDTSCTGVQVVMSTLL